MPTKLAIQGLLQSVNTIREIGFNNIASVDADLTELSILHTDRLDHIHNLKIGLGLHPEITYDLPISINAKSSIESYIEYIARWKATIEKLEPFWLKLKELEQDCWVLEPEEHLPMCSFSIKYRRIALAKNVTLRLEISDPLQPNKIPLYQIFGDPKSVTEYNTRFAHRIHTIWNPLASYKSNIEAIVQGSLPLPPDQTILNETSLLCGICMSFVLDGTSPGINCPKCCKCFHPYCIKEWLQSLVGTRRVYKNLIGECPYCKDSITVKD